jgi:hypothetical protein
MAALVSIQALSPELIVAGGLDEIESAKLAEAKKIIIPRRRRLLLKNLIGFADDIASAKTGLTSQYLANAQQSLRGIWRPPPCGAVKSIQPRCAPLPEQAAECSPTADSGRILV